MSQILHSDQCRCQECSDPFAFATGYSLQKAVVVRCSESIERKVRAQRELDGWKHLSSRIAGQNAAGKRVEMVFVLQDE